MTFPQGWRLTRRWAAAGTVGGTLLLSAAGCRSLDREDAHPPWASSAYHDFGKSAATPTPVGRSATTTGSVIPASAVASPEVALLPAERGAISVWSSLPQTEIGPRFLEPTELPPPTASPAATEHPIYLGVALRLAGVDNPTINLAEEQVREAMAGLLAARSLLLPSVNVGGNYHLHNGNLEASPGIIRDVDSRSLYLGFGARSLAAESVAFPGVRLFAHLGDAYYEPLAARQRVAARRSDAQAVQNDVLLRVATRYLELVGAEARLDTLRLGLADVEEVVRLTRVYAEKGQGRPADAERATARAELVRRNLHQAEEDAAVVAAELCRLLNLDPAVRLRGPGGPIPLFLLVPEDADIEPLVAEALKSRPEVFARSAEIQEAQVRSRQERVRPLVPLLSVGYSGGLFGGGSNLVDPAFGPLKGRSDFDVAAVWTVQGFGFGNRALVRRANAVVGEAVAGYQEVAAQVGREVAEAQAEARAAARQEEIARATLATAEEGYRLEKQRITVGGPNVGRPIALLDSFEQLLDTRLEYVRAAVAFDVAQFRLFVAVGSSPLAADTTTNGRP